MHFILLLITVVGLSAGTLILADQPRPTSAPATSRFTDADYAAHVTNLKKTLPAGFHVVIEKPFVVVGDESPARVRQRAAGTVRFAVERLRRDFFERDPDDIITIWLFKDAESYQKHARSIFGDKPTTPFGYYSPAHKALVMNIATGGGTLVHEIVHPFMRANFPECPAWFNEGLGSLYEQSEDRNGHIWGLTNWRLAGLQKAIREKQLPSFKALLSTTDEAFYRDDGGTNYAQARYLCYYLQEKGLLKCFYRESLAAHKDDPTGHKTLCRVLEREDLVKFQEEWETFVLGLRFP